MWHNKAAITLLLIIIFSISAQTTLDSTGRRRLNARAGSNPAEDVGFLGRKNPQHAFRRRGSKAVGPMS